MTAPVQYAPRRVESALAAGAGLVLLGVATGIAVDTDAAGTLLVGLAGILLVGLALADSAVRPRLRADGDGLTARTLSRQLAGPWAVVTIRVRPARRLGVVAHTLEIDVGDELVVFGRRELGADPREVAEALDALRAQA